MNNTSSQLRPPPAAVTAPPSLPGVGWSRGACNIMECNVMQYNRSWNGMGVRWTRAASATQHHRGDGQPSAAVSASTVPFHSILFHSVPFHSIPLHVFNCIVFHSIPLHYLGEEQRERPQLIEDARDQELELRERVPVSGRDAAGLEPLRLRVTATRTRRREPKHHRERGRVRTRGAAARRSRRTPPLRRRRRRRRAARTTTTRCGGLRGEGDGITCLLCFHRRPLCKHDIITHWSGV